MPWVTITPSLESFDDKEDARKAAIRYARALWPKPVLLGWEHDTIMFRSGEDWLPTHVRVREIPRHVVDYPGKEFR